MSIQPIDLQTLFLKMSQVGKDQAVEKESAILQQAAKGSEIEKRNQHSDTSVNKANNSEGPEKTKGEKEHSGQNHDKRKHNKNSVYEDKEILTDPDLGKNIDISG